MKSMIELLNIQIKKGGTDAAFQVRELSAMHMRQDYSLLSKDQQIFHKLITSAREYDVSLQKMISLAGNVIDNRNTGVLFQNLQIMRKEKQNIIRFVKQLVTELNIEIKSD